MTLSPMSLCFFAKDVDLLPLVVKDNTAFFYGGKISNEYNQLPKNKNLLNESIEFLLKNNIVFKLLSVKNDCIDILNEDYKQYDVPINLNWVYEDISTYGFNSLLEGMKQKKRTRIRKWASSLNENYEFRTISQSSFMNELNHILKMQINSFENMAKPSGWVGHEELFVKIITHFITEYNSLVRYLYRDGELVGMYLFVYDENMIVIYFAGYFDRNDHSITTLIYLDKLEMAQKIGKENNIHYVDALRGSFTYKRRMGFTPQPLYALVE